MDAWIKNPNRQPMLTSESFKSVFENSPTAMLVEGEDGDVRDANASACELFGSSLDEIIGKHSNELIPEETVPAKLPETSQRIGSISCKNGSTIRVSMHSAPIKSDSESVYLVSVWPAPQSPSPRNNERVQNEEAIKTSPHLNMQYASRHIANVLSDSLTPIQGFVSLAQADLKQGRIRSTHLEQIASAADRGASFARDLFTFSSPTPQESNALFPGEILGSLQTELAEIAGDTATITCSIPQDCPAISISHHDFCTIMRHAVANAAANADINNNRHITISCSTAPLLTTRNNPSTLPSTIITISDNGPELSGDISARVFDPFHSLPEREDPQGLRLPTIQQLIKNHGGSTQFLSTPDKGNSLKLLFLQSLSIDEEPRMSDGSDQKSHPRRSAGITTDAIHHSQSATSVAADKTILVVEDESSVRETVVRNLQYLGYNVLEAKNGEDGLSISRQHKDKIDLIFSDVVMPRMSGPAMISLMKQEKIKVPVLYTTGYADAPGIANDDQVIAKPYTTNLLAARIREILDPVEAG